MYTEIEQTFVKKLQTIGPPLYREQRDQFARSLPLLALLSVLFVGVLGGWLSAIISTFGDLISTPTMLVPLLLSPYFFLELLPPILWAASYFPLQDRRLIGWRLFVLATLLALIASILRFSIINVLFSAAILYFTVQCYDEYYRQ
jgi:hypothetical protein